MDFWGRMKNAFDKAYLSGIKSAFRSTLTKIYIILGISLFFIVLFIGIILDLDGESGGGSNTDESMKTFGEDYVVNTSISEADIIVTDSRKLIDAINSLGYSEQAKTNLIDNIDAFLGIQQQYNVNAVFGIAVTLKESCAGTAWDLIDPSTYNWISRQKGSSWTGKTYTDRKGVEWRWYNSYEEATYDFGSLISESSYYFGGENYTVVSISKSYCKPPEEWANGVISIMTDIFEACGVDTSKYDTVSVTGKAIVDKAAELYMIMYEEEYGYNQNYHSSTPPISSQDYCSDSYTKQHGSKGTSGRHTKLTDCSGFVNWVLYEVGIGKFTLSTAEWINFDPSVYRIRRYLYCI